MRLIYAARSHSGAFKPAIVVMLAVAAFSLTLPSTSYAQTTLTVCSSGCGYTSIASAVAAANSGDTISVNEPVDTESTTVNVSNLTLTIEGQGVSSTTVDGSGGAPVFNIGGNAAVTIQGMTVSNGYNSGGSGGGIVNNGALTIKDAAVTGNISSSGNGGGIANYGTLSIDNSTVSGNTAYLFGGGIENTSGGSVTVTGSTFSGNIANYGGALANISGSVTTTNSTFSGNTAYVYGGGIYNASTLTISFSTIASNSADGSSSPGGGIYNTGTATVDNSIIGDNTTGGDCSGTISAPTSNTSLSLDTDGTCGTADFTRVLSTNLNLGPLALNPPGTTETMALAPGSSAVDIAPNCNDASGATVSTDQRGVSRPQPAGGSCDIGAYELQSSKATSSISTAIDFGQAIPTNTGDAVPTTSGIPNPVTMGAFIHDNATVTTTVDPIPYGSTVTFNVFPANSCGGTLTSTDTQSLNDTTYSESVESSGTSGVSAFGPLPVGGVAYQTAFTSADTSSVPSIPRSSDTCESLNVQSPINQFGYMVDSGTTLYTCTLEAMASNGGTCPTGQQEGSVAVNTTHNFVVNVQVTNLTGIPVSEYVEGTLPSGKNFSYTTVSTSPNCGGAVVKGNGDVLWNANGAHSPNAAGFTMNPGDVCDLQVTVTATFTATGQQAIASQWYTTQTETSPVTGQSLTLTSPTTGSLAVDVTQ